MRLCANENLPGVCIAAPHPAGHDVLWARETMPGASDDAVLARARAESRLLLTFGKDFGALAFHRGAAVSHGIILLRIGQPSAEAVAHAITRLLAWREDWTGNFSVVDEQTIRMRPLP